MRKTTLFLTLFLLLISCSEKHTPKNYTIAFNENDYDLIYDCIDAASGDWALSRIGNETALKIQGYGDESGSGIILYFNVKKYFNRNFNLFEMDRINFRIFIKEDSWIPSQMKMQVYDSLGNASGIDKFYAEFEKLKINEWNEISVDIKKSIKNAEWTVWQGTKSAIRNFERFEWIIINPNRLNRLHVYFDDIILDAPSISKVENPANFALKELHDGKLKLAFNQLSNQKRFAAARAFDVDQLAFANHIAGNSTYALRGISANGERGVSIKINFSNMMKDGFLDFSQIKKLSFRYYLPDPAEKISRFHLILRDDSFENFLEANKIDLTFKYGEWAQAEINLDELNFNDSQDKDAILKDTEQLQFFFLKANPRGKLELWLDDIILE